MNIVRFYTMIFVQINLVIKKLLFIVQDKEALLKSIFDKGYNINQGPQQWKGQINSMSNFLNYLYIDYRKLLYNHSKLHYNKGNLDNSWKD